MMTKETRNRLNAIEKGGLLRDVILGMSTALIGIGAGRTMAKEAATENAVKTLKTDVAGITAEVSTIKDEVSAIKTNIDEVKTAQTEQNAKLDQILAAIAPAPAPASKTTAPKGSTPTTAPKGSTPTTAPVVTSIGAKPKRVVL